MKILWESEREAVKWFKRNSLCCGDTRPGRGVHRASVPHLPSINQSYINDYILAILINQPTRPTGTADRYMKEIINKRVKSKEISFVSEREAATMIIF
jgi:hypothetical protein